MGKSKSILKTFSQGPVSRIESSMGESTCTRHTERDQKPAQTAEPLDTDMMCARNRRNRNVQGTVKITGKIESSLQHLTGTGRCKAKQRQITTKPPARREPTGRQQLHQERFPRWHPSAPSKTPEELTWAELKSLDFWDFRQNESPVNQTPGTRSSPAFERR
ncbi:hypothetical protein HPB52_008136 [Rhipicephalus sanguineus]|uniref:Uncharacterized protein n=1 Tax=Rhipicephalus sanguineus TaxID=34632 RepID=A0A9D4SY05_RHISA|nr:hypothetical protein HPB52_008136 [Rhipicephalus sanguineus]